MSAQYENRKLRPLAPQFLQNLQASLSRHGDVEYDDIPTLFFGKLERFMPVVRFSHKIHIAFLRQGFFQPRAKNWMIVGDENSHWKGVSWYLIGTLTVTSVPPPGRAATFVAPPKDRARSRMPSNTIAATKPNLSRTTGRSSVTMV